MLLQHVKAKTRQKCVIYEDKPKTRQERVIQLHIQYKRHIWSEKITELQIKNIILPKNSELLFSDNVFVRNEITHQDYLSKFDMINFGTQYNENGQNLRTGKT